MKAVILCGGKGTRLSSMTDGRPKALLNVQGKTVTEHIFDLLKRHGTRDCILAVGYKADMIKERFGDGSAFGLKISYTEEKQPLGTAGPLKIAKNTLRETFIVSNGDELKDIDISSMLALHMEHKALATIALTQVEDTTQYGIVEMDGAKILRFVEKPPADKAPSKLASAGFYIIEPEVLEMIPEGFAMLEKDVFPRLASMGRLFGFKFEGQWFDTGTPERYSRAVKEWKGVG